MARGDAGGRPWKMEGQPLASVATSVSDSLLVANGQRGQRGQPHESLQPLNNAHGSSWLAIAIAWLLFLFLLSDTP